MLVKDQVKLAMGRLKYLTKKEQKRMLKALLFRMFELEEIAILREEDLADMEQFVFEDTLPFWESCGDCII